MRKIEKTASLNDNFCHDEDAWEEEYALFCSPDDDYEDDDDCGYITTHYRDDASQVSAERLAIDLMEFLSELRHREIQEYKFRYRDDGQPEIEIDFFDHNLGQYGTGVHLFSTTPAGG